MKNVILIHGLFGNKVVMIPLGMRLKKAGFNVFYFDYYSVKKTLRNSADLLHKKIKELQLEQVHLVAHSLGGLVVLHLFDQFDDIPKGRVVTLGSPVNGSMVALKLHEWHGAKYLLGASWERGLSGKDIPNWKGERDWGMMAGTKSVGAGKIVFSFEGENDGTVAVGDTFHDGQKQHIIVPFSHSDFLLLQKPADLVVKFLETGEFE